MRRRVTNIDLSIPPTNVMSQTPCARFHEQRHRAIANCPGPSSACAERLPIEKQSGVRPCHGASTCRALLPSRENSYRRPDGVQSSFGVSIGGVHSGDPIAEAGSPCHVCAKPRESPSPLVWRVDAISSVKYSLLDPARYGLRCRR